jgi:tetratricopeptide (TPR) repeat protein
MRKASTVASLALGLGLGFQSPVALAASDNSDTKEQASDGDPNKERRDWMNKGNAEYVQRNWEAARDCYRKSWDIKHHYTIAANLADVEIKMGHYAEAAAYLKYVLANLPENKPGERKAAEERLLECREHLTVVRVATDVTDATVLVDGRDVGQTPLREDLLLEPGKHVISVTKPGYSNASQELSAEGSKVELTLTLDKASAPAPEATAPLIMVRQEPPATPDSTKWKNFRVGSYVGLGVGAVGIGLGTFFLLRAHNTQSDSDNRYSACGAHCSSAEKANIADSDQSALHQRTASAVSFIVGGVGLATGVTLFILGPKKPTAPTAISVRPWVGIGQAGLSGSF